MKSCFIRTTGITWCETVKTNIYRYFKLRVSQDSLYISSLANQVFHDIFWLVIAPWCSDVEPCRQVSSLIHCENSVPRSTLLNYSNRNHCDLFLVRIPIRICQLIRTTMTSWKHNQRTESWIRSFNPNSCQCNVSHAPRSIDIYEGK